jgi:hypothetical protein
MEVDWRVGRSLRALGEGGGGGPVGAAGLWGKTAGIGGGAIDGLGSIFSWSFSKNSVVEKFNGTSSARGEDPGVLFRESVLMASRA